MRDTKLFKRFISYYRPHIGLFTLDIICAVAAAGLELLFPALTRLVMQDYLDSENFSIILFILGILLAAYLLKWFFDYIMNYWGHVVGVRIEADMRSDLFHHMQLLPFRFYDKNRTGELMSRMINDLRWITELSHHAPEDILVTIVMVIGSFIFLLGIEWRLTLIIYLIFFPALIWFTISRRRKLSRTSREEKLRVADVNAELQNSISGIRVAQSFTNEKFEQKKFARANSKFKLAQSYALKELGIFISGMNLITGLINIGVLGFGAWFIHLKSINIADLTAFFLYLNLVIKPIHRLTNLTQQFERGITGFERFEEIMRVEPEIQDEPDAIEIANVSGNIRFEDVTFSYEGTQHVLKNIHLDIRAGETIAIVGPSGGGKTTLCHLIPRFYESSAGKITVDGCDIKKITLESLRKNIGLVSQDVFIFNGTIRDNIQYGNSDATEQDIIWAAKQAMLSDMIDDLPDGLDTQVGERGAKLSGGQKQRISIARVFLKNPPILLLDEATSALDNQTERAIQKSLEKLSIGRTILVVAHRLSTIKNASRIVVLTQDGIEEKGTHNELYALNGIYKNLYDSQFSND